MSTGLLNERSKNKHKEKKHKEKKRKRHGSPSEDVSKKARLEARKSTPTTSTISSASTNNPYYVKTVSLYLALPPRYSYFPDKTFAHLLSSTGSSEQASHMRSLSPIIGVQKHHLDPLLMTYYEPVDGVVLAYDNIRFESTTARIIAEAPYAHVWTTVELLVWRPRNGMVLRGGVNLQSAGHIGLLVENTWNVSIPIARIPEGWKYQEGTVAAAAAGTEAGAMDTDSADTGENGMQDGSWLDGTGKKVEKMLLFQVESVQAGGSIFIIEGSLLNQTYIQRAVVPELATQTKMSKTSSS